MARKHHPPEKTYPAAFSVRLTERERAELTKLANGQPLGQFIKDTILQNSTRSPPSSKPGIQNQKVLAMLPGTLRQFHIASNINQLAKAVNSDSLPINEGGLQNLHNAVAAIRWMRDNLIEEMGLKPQVQQPPPGPYEGMRNGP